MKKIGKVNVDVSFGKGIETVEADLVALPFGAGSAHIDPVVSDKEVGAGVRVYTHEVIPFDHPQFGKCVIADDLVVLDEEGNFLSVLFQKYDEKNNAISKIDYNSFRKASEYQYPSYVTT